MNHKQHLSRLLLFVVLSLSLTGCMAQLGTGWAGLTVLNDGTHIVFALESNVSIVDVVNGEAIPLLDSEGDVQLDDSGAPLTWNIQGRDFDNAQFFAAPLQLDDETLFIPTQDRRLLRVDIATATVINPDVEPTIGRGSAVTNAIITESKDNILLGLQERLVSFSTETFQTEWSVVTEHAVWGEPVIVEDTVYFISLDHFMRSADLETGDVKWELDLRGAAAGKPAYDPETNMLFIGTFNNEVLKISAETGEIVESYETTEWVWGGPILVDNMLYVSDLNGFVFKLDPETMTEDGGWKADVADGAIRTPPLVFGDFVVVGSRDQNVYWLNRDTGNVVFTRQLDGEILSDLLYFPADEGLGIDEDMVVVSTMSKREALVAFVANTSERVWTYRR